MGCGEEDGGTAEGGDAGADDADVFLALVVGRGWGRDEVGRHSRVGVRSRVFEDVKCSTG